MAEFENAEQIINAPTSVVLQGSAPEGCPELKSRFVNPAKNERISYELLGDHGIRIKCKQEKGNPLCSRCVFGHDGMPIGDAV